MNVRRALGMNGMSAEQAKMSCDEEIEKVLVKGAIRTPILAKFNNVQGLISILRRLTFLSGVRGLGSQQSIGR